MTWIFNGKQLTEDEIPTGAFGYIYVIHLPDGRKYLGRKQLTKAAYKMVNGKRKKLRKQSDWADYWSSSPVLLAEIEANGTAGYVREIIMFCSTKGMLAYCEEHLQHVFCVLHSPNWLNGNIRSRLFKKNLIGKQELSEMSKIKSRTDLLLTHRQASQP